MICMLILIYINYVPKMNLNWIKVHELRERKKKLTWYLLNSKFVFVKANFLISKGTQLLSC